MSTPFSGLLDGVGNTITRLTINRANEQQVGLFGSISRGKVRNLSLIGELQDGIVQGTYAIGAVTGTEAVGGLIGKTSHGDIAHSYAAGTVSGTISVGGLLGAASRLANVDSSYWDIYATGQAQAFAPGSLNRH